LIQISTAFQKFEGDANSVRVWRK